MQKFFLVTFLFLAVVFPTLYARSLLKDEKPYAVAQTNEVEEVIPNTDAQPTAPIEDGVTNRNPDEAQDIDLSNSHESAPVPEEVLQSPAE